MDVVKDRDGTDIVEISHFPCLRRVPRTIGAMCIGAVEGVVLHVLKPAQTHHHGICCMYYHYYLPSSSSATV